jgi:hypothetical protein
MDAITNPYVPGAGTQPPELAGREDILERTRVTLARVKLGRASKSFMLVGLRGVGKTVLLNRIEQMAREDGYEAILVEAHESKSLPALLVPPLRRLLLDLDRGERVNEVVKKSLGVLRAFANSVKLTVGEVDFGLNIEPVVGSADSGDLEADLPELFLAVARAAKARDTAAAIIIDELQYLSEAEMSALIMAVHKVSQQNLPLILVGAGLPQLVGLAGKSKSYAERLFDYPPVGALKAPDAKRAIAAPAEREGVSYTAEALDDIVNVTQGYPYFLQEWGYHSWLHAQGTPIDAHAIREASREAVESLDESFFRVRFDRLTPREKDYLFAMAKLGAGPHRSGDIAAELKVAVESVAPVRSSLIKKGMVYSPAHGDTAFTVPLFDEYLRRVLDKATR